MIQKLTIATIYCTDQQAARDFYVDTLGLEVRSDAESGGVRWILVGPKEQPDISVMLVAPGPPLSAESADALERLVSAGGWNPLTFAVDDCRATISDLQGRGVEIVHEPTEQPFGVEALIRDPAGNTLALIEYRR